MQSEVVYRPYDTRAPSRWSGVLLWGRDHWRLRLHMWNSVDGRTVAAVDARLGLDIVGTSCSFSYNPTLLLAATDGD